MHNIDSAVQWSMDRYEFSQVLVMLDDSAATESSIDLAASINRSNHRSDCYLQELPTQISMTAADVREQISRSFDPALPEGIAALAAAHSVIEGMKPSRSRRASPPPTAKAPNKRTFPRLGLEWGYVDRAGLSRLSKDPQVDHILSVEALSAIYPVEIRTARPRNAGWTWGLERLRIPELRSRGLTGKGIKVGHLDTGIDVSHVAFKSANVTFQEFNFEGEPIGGKPRDSGRHGTHTAGTICGGKVGKLNIGVAPDAELYSGIVISGGPVVRILAGIEWCLENHVRIINMSFGYPGWHPFLVKVLQRVLNLGVFPVIAIGNDGIGTSYSPGNYVEALSVGATNRKDEVSAFSSSIIFNRANDPFEPNIVAPGEGIVSAKPGAGLLSMDGTSMAAPHVSGCLALMLQHKPETSPARLLQAIEITCSRMERFSKKNSESRRGYGLIDPIRALDLL